MRMTRLRYHKLDESEEVKLRKLVTVRMEKIFAPSSPYKKSNSLNGVSAALARQARKCKSESYFAIIHDILDPKEVVVSHVRFPVR